MMPLTLETVLTARLPTPNNKSGCGFRNFISRKPSLPSSQRINKQILASGMHVPSDSFGGVSPERKAGEILRTFFTFAAVKIIAAQLEGDGRGSLGAFNASSYTTLSKFLQTHPLRNNSDEWLAKLMAEDELLAVRIMEVRAAYSRTDFEWDNCQRVTVQEIEKANTAVMRQHAQSRFGGLLAQQDDEGEGGGGEG